MGVIDASLRTHVTTSRVRSRLLPPAPYVPDPTPGGSGSGSAIVRPRASWAPSVFGGKNSNEHVRPAASRSDTLAIRSERTGASGALRGTGGAHKTAQRPISQVVRGPRLGARVERSTFARSPAAARRYRSGRL